MMSLTMILVALAGYALLLLAVGWFSARRAGNATFFAADRRMAWYVVWPAMISAAMSGITFVSVPGSVAEDGFSYLQMVLGFTVGQLLIAFWLVPLFYRWRYTSLYEYFGDRFGPKSHRTGAWCFFLSKLVTAALKLYIVAAVLQVLLFDQMAIPFWLNVLVMMIVVWGYTLRGGVRSLLATDLLKTALMVATLLVVMVAICSAMGWGLPELSREVAASPFSQVFFFDDPTSDRYFWKMFPAGILLLVAMTGLDQELMQRNLACRSQRDAQRNILLTALCQAVVIALFLVLGVVLYRYALAVGLPIPNKGDELFALVATRGGLSAWIGALFVVGFASASFSAAGGSLTALTTSCAIDLLEGNRRFDEQGLRKVRYGLHTLLSGVMFGLVCLFGYAADESTINLIYKVAGYTYGPVLGFFLFGLWTRREVRDRWTWLAAVAGPLTVAVLQFCLSRYDVQIGFELLLYNAAIVMAVLALLSRRKATS